MSRGDLVMVEERLRRTLHEVAATVPDKRATTDPPAVALRPLPDWEEPAGTLSGGATRGRRRVAALLAAAAVTLAVVVGSVALLTAGSGRRAVQVGAGNRGETATTAATPQPTGLAEVPDVVGKAQAEAMAILDGAGFAVQVVGRPGSPAGIVVEQDPPDRRAAPNAQVKIFVATG